MFYACVQRFNVTRNLKNSAKFCGKGLKWGNAWDTGTAWLLQRKYRTINKLVTWPCPLSLHGPAKKCRKPWSTSTWAHLQRATCDYQLFTVVHACILPLLQQQGPEPKQRKRLGPLDRKPSWRITVLVLSVSQNNCLSHFSGSPTFLSLPRF
jgi:hypothetical protein